MFVVQLINANSGNEYYAVLPSARFCYVFFVLCVSFVLCVLIMKCILRDLSYTTDCVVGAYNLCMHLYMHQNAQMCSYKANIYHFVPYMGLIDPMPKFRMRGDGDELHDDNTLIRTTKLRNYQYPTHPHPLPMRRRGGMGWGGVGGGIDISAT